MTKDVDTYCLLPSKEMFLQLHPYCFGISSLLSEKKYVLVLYYIYLIRKVEQLFIHIKFA